MMITRYLIKVASALLLLVYLIPGAGLPFKQKTTLLFCLILFSILILVIWNVTHYKETSRAHMRCICSRPAGLERSLTIVECVIAEPSISCCVPRRRAERHPSDPIPCHTHPGPSIRRNNSLETSSFACITDLQMTDELSCDRYIHRH